MFSLFFLYRFFKEKSLGLLSAYLKTFQIQFVSVFLCSKSGVFLAEVNGTGTKRIMNVIFFSPVTVHYIAFSSSLCEFI